MKKFLLATAAVLASTSAYAADYAVVHPFYTPAQGKFVSTTELEYEHSLIRAKVFDVKRIDSEITLSEEVKYGVTDDVQVGLTIGRDWSKRKMKSNTAVTGPAGRDYTNSWGLNVGYNIINDGKAFLNASLGYAQTVTADNDPANNDEEHAKIIDLEFLGGYNFDAATVFGSIGYTRQVDGEKLVEKSKIYSLEAGVFKAFNDQISAYTTLSADIDETKDAEERTYWWNVGADYSISKKMAVGVNAGYMLANDKDDATMVPETHSAYKLGVDFTVEF